MSNPEVISVGNMLVEIMRTELDRPLNLPAEFAGRFPCGEAPTYVLSARVDSQVRFLEVQR